MLQLVMVVLSSAIIVLGVVVILLANERERRVSAMKSEFVANVSHELKTPLALVRMFAEMLQSGRVASEEKRQQYLDIIVSESERLSALIENVLDFARVERGRQAYEFAEGDVGEAVSKAVNVYRYRAEREGVELATELEPNLPSARIDDRAIQLAVINLLDNALKYAAGSERVDRACPTGERQRGRPCGRPRTGRPSRGSRAHLRALRAGFYRPDAERGAPRSRQRDRPGTRQAHRREPRRPGLGRLDDLGGHGGCPRRYLRNLHPARLMHACTPARMHA